MQFAPQKPQQRRVSKKMQQFLDEISDISKHYQYNLEARISYTPKGIIPSLFIVEAVPPKREKKKASKKKAPGRKKVKRGSKKS